MTYSLYGLQTLNSHDVRNENEITSAFNPLTLTLSQREKEYLIKVILCTFLNVGVIDTAVVFVRFLIWRILCFMQSF